MRKTQVELKTDLNLSLAKLCSPPQTPSPGPHCPSRLTSIAQDGRAGLAIGHQALWRLVWVGKSWGQAWGEYNTDRNVNYCGGGRGMTRVLGIGPGD